MPARQPSLVRKKGVRRSTKSAVSTRNPTSHTTTIAAERPVVSKPKPNPPTRPELPKPKPKTLPATPNTQYRTGLQQRLASEASLASSFTQSGPEAGKAGGKSFFDGLLQADVRAEREGCNLTTAAGSCLFACLAIDSPCSLACLLSAVRSPLPLTALQSPGARDSKLSQSSGSRGSTASIDLSAIDPYITTDYIARKMKANVRLSFACMQRVCGRR